MRLGCEQPSKGQTPDFLLGLLGVSVEDLDAGLLGDDEGVCQNASRAASRKLLRASAGGMTPVPFRELGVPVDLNAFAAIQGVGSSLDVLAEGFELHLVGLTEVGEVWRGFFDLKQSQWIRLLEIGEQLPKLLRGELGDLLAEAFDVRAHRG